MSKKKVKLAPANLLPSVLRQLWIVELVADREKKIYVYADRWFDVREVGGMKLGVSDYGLLFISVVIGDIEFGETPIWEVEYSGAAPNLQKRVLQWHNTTPR